MDKRSLSPRLYVGILAMVEDGGVVTNDFFVLGLFLCFVVVTFEDVPNCRFSCRSD